MAANLHYVEMGTRGGPTLLLIHPLGSSHLFWEEAAAIWAERYHVVAIDLRGAGASPIPDRPWKADEHVRDVISVREALGLRDVIVVGCAMGSMVAGAYTAADAAFVRALIVSNTTTELGEASRERHESRLKMVADKGMEALLPWVIDMAFDRLPRDQRYTRYLERFRHNDPRGYASLALGMIGTDNSSILAALKIPVLVVAGGADTLLPPELGRKVHALAENSEFTILGKAAHFAPYQAPEEFARLVTDFIERKVANAA